MRKVYNVNQIKNIIKSKKLDESTQQIIGNLLDCYNNKEISLEELSELISDNTSVGCSVCLAQESILNGKCDWECERGIFKWFATELLEDDIDELKNKYIEPVHCKDCQYLMFSDCYGECGKGYKGIVNPNDTCEHGVKKYTEKK